VEAAVGVEDEVAGVEREESDDARLAYAPRFVRLVHSFGYTTNALGCGAQAASTARH
jgi:hypothetical protein